MVPLWKLLAAATVIFIVWACVVAARQARKAGSTARHGGEHGDGSVMPSDSDSSTCADGGGGDGGGGGD